MTRKILVTGFGNTLLRDEGIGVHLVAKLQERGNYPPQIEFRRGGTSSVDLIPFLKDVAHLIIVDAMKGGKEPGSVYELSADELKITTCSGLSIHELDISQTLDLAGRLGYRPPVSIIGIEPFNMNELSLELSPVLQAKVPEYLDLLDKRIKEIAARYA